ncbi:MAG: Radical SAM additional 4Fe4S-binding domain protein [Parcubacteria group bacterium GW2011_GWA2_45_14]|nr:MAG: Radical SAM additional 4Fe4S-binding domain protein [Parcubacteria group bacterium GW2011_GWA2_45_14]
MRDYMILSTDFTLKGSHEEQVLLHLAGGEKYELTRDQYDLLCLFDGSFTLSQIHSQYDRASQIVIEKFLARLNKLGAITSSSKRGQRKAQRKLVSSPRLKNVQLEATSVCNLSCAHCYQASMYPVYKNITRADCDELIAQLSTMQVEGVSISGGEPLLDSKTIHLAHEVERNDMRVTSLFTNGLLLDKDIAAEISSWRSQPTIFISLDTLVPENFRFRSIQRKAAKIALGRVFDGITMITSKGLPIVINTAVNQCNLSKLFDMHEYIKNLGIASWRLGFPKRTGNFRDSYHDLEVPWDNLLSASFALLRHHLECGNPFHIQIEYLYRDELFADMAMLPDSSYVCDYEGRRNSCCIKPNGDVVSCAYCSKMPLGNILIQRMESIWYSGSMQSIKNMRICDVTECCDCTLRGYCAAGCRANASFLGGDFKTSKDPYACQAVRYFVDQVLPYLRQQGIAK